MQTREQERMMTSFLIAEGGERAGNCQKFETDRIYVPRVLKIEHTFAQVDSSTSQHTVTLVINKICAFQAYLESSTYTGTVVGPS